MMTRWLRELVVGRRIKLSRLRRRSLQRRHHPARIRSSGDPRDATTITPATSTACSTRLLSASPAQSHLLYRIGLSHVRWAACAAFISSVGRGMSRFSSKRLGLRRRQRWHRSSGQVRLLYRLEYRLHALRDRSPSGLRHYPSRRLLPRLPGIGWRSLALLKRTPVPAHI